MSKRHRASTPNVSTKMEVDRASEPINAEVNWSVKLGAGANALEASVHLEEDGHMSLSASFGDRGPDVDRDVIDYFRCTRGDVRLLARALTALAEQVDAEHDASRRRLATWRSRYNTALTPLA